jgi:ligand-binding sensor domain-containing protein
MKRFFLSLFLAGFFYTASAQTLSKTAASLTDGGVFNGYLYGNGISDILFQQDTIIWAATNYGLNRSNDEGNTWTSYGVKQLIGKGGVSAIALMDSSTLWIATVFDTVVQGDQSLIAGGGLSYTKDQGKTWTHIPQPVDSRDEQDYFPTTTNVQNTTWDIAFVDSTIWIASWGGGLRRSDDMGKTWQVVTTDGEIFDVKNKLNHVAFSLLNENGNLWVGTAEGISKSADNGKTWERFTHQNQEAPISGNFVVAVAYQEYNHTVWAATNTAVDTSERRGLSKTNNGGHTWEVSLQGVFVHNISFDGARVYAASDDGIFFSDDEGATWYKIPPVFDRVTNEELFGTVFYCSATQPTVNGTRVWIGGSDGMAYTEDNGNNWRVIRSFVSTKIRTTPPVYAYPSPFSPSRDDYIRFQFDMAQSGDVKITIYDFAMAEVAAVSGYYQIADKNNSDRNIKWDGKNYAGDVAASGVYFFKAEINGKTSWGKLVIIN